ncbi:MAG TPA: aspartate/glutamate racemase family protein [Stellaceae bacterium]|nr:aspartate/glutamate racemase family protein [Stellaceae bacterium]
MKTRIALIHAVTVAMDPVQEAFRRLWPEAECCNILDDSLSLDRERDGELTAAIRQRIGDLAEYAAAISANGILFTCSAFGEAIEATAARLPIPVLKPNEAMFEAALAVGGRIAMLATFAPSVGSMEDEFRDMAATAQSRATIETYCVPGAMAALRAGDGAEHDRLIAQAAPRFADCDAILLAHFSTARAAQSVTAVLGRPVLTSPGSAVAKLKAIIRNRQALDQR